MGKPIEFLSNFYLKSEGCGDDDDDSKPIPFRAKRFRVDAKNADELVDEVVDEVVDKVVDEVVDKNSTIKVEQEK